MAKEKEIGLFWEMQGSKSFVKARTDWMEYDKIRLSFVRHSGRKNGAAQEAAIEGAIPIHGNAGALFLSHLILSGGAKAIAKKRKADVENGQPMQPIFTNYGGTPASRSADGICKSRQFSLCVGSKIDYIMQMVICEGIEGAGGEIRPKPNAQRETIAVGVPTENLVDFAISVQQEAAAFRTAKMLGIEPCLRQRYSPNEENTVPVQEPAPVQTPAPTAPVQSAPAPTAQSEPTKIAMISSDSPELNGGFPFAVTLDHAAETLKSAIETFTMGEDKYRCSLARYNEAKKVIEAGKTAGITIDLKSKVDESKTARIVVTVDKIR